jgi:hypothetical protein
MISTLDANKAVGPDIISNNMLIAVKVQISKPLCMLFNKSLHQNIFPTDWKLAHANCNKHLITYDIRSNSFISI